MMLDSIDQQGHIHTKCRHGGVARNLAMTRGRQLQCLSLSLRQSPCHFKFNVQELAILYLFYIVIMFMSLKLHGIVECSSRYTNFWWCYSANKHVGDYQHVWAAVQCGNSTVQMHLPRHVIIQLRTQHVFRHLILQNTTTRYKKRRGIARFVVFFVIT